MSAKEPEKSNSSIASFENLPVEDGSLTAPAASGVKKAQLEGDAVMSDDDSKVITTLETAKPASEKVIIHSQTIIKPADATDGSKSLNPAANDMLAKMKSRLSKQIDLNIISTPKMHQHPQMMHGSHDSSGSIEIPTDFILSSDIPTTPMTTAHVAKEELEDHDLIAILEGDDVEITENATEIEVRVGGGDAGMYDEEQVLEEIHISIVDEQDLESEKKEREKEIAMRQMANLPQLPKGRRPKLPHDTSEWPEAKLPVVKPVTSKRYTPRPPGPALPALKVEPTEGTPPPKPKLETKITPTKPVTGTPGLVTIKGQTTIMSLPRPIIIKTEPTDKGGSPSPTKKVMVPPSKPASVSKPLTQKPASVSNAQQQKSKSISNALPQKSASASSVVPQKSASVSSAVPQKSASVSNAVPQKSASVSSALPQKTASVPNASQQKPVGQRSNPPVPRPIPLKVASNDLISSIVSDWDDEPLVPKKEPVSPVASPHASKPAPAAVLPMAPPQPPATEEPLKRSRVIKKKIIWDPDNPETHMSFSSFVKSNRTKPLPEIPVQAKAIPVPVRPPGTGIRRKRAESVAVHMIKDTSTFAAPPPRKRARTPEPVFEPLVTPASPVAPKGPGRKKKSEIEKLLGDEGAINMLYDVECENSNKDLLKTSDIKVDSDDEDEKLIAKTKIITDAVIKQGHSPNETTTHVPRMRQKRVPTPQQMSTSPVPTTTSTSGPSRKANTAANGAGRKRKHPNSASEDWDYVYNSQKTCDEAMIIRRRSNSSYSSSASPRRLSVDQPGVTPNETSTNSPEKSNFQFVKPSNKTPPKPENIKLDSSLVANMKGKLSKALGSKKEAKEDQTANISSPSTPAGTKPEKKLKVSPKVISTETATATTPTTTTAVRVEENGTGKSWESLLEKLTELNLQELTYKRCGNYMEITLAPKETKLKDVFTIELINELKTVLNILKNDPNTRAVLLRSSGKHFCRGIDVSYLIQTNAEKRKTAAQVYSGHLRNFLQALAVFNKPLVAVVHGDVLGLGVTMLPLFEVVIAQDNTTFQTPYATLGHLPEAMKLFTSAKNLKPKAITDLLYLCKKVSANMAMDYGIVSEVVNSEKLQDRADIITKKLASLSQQALKSMKVSLRQDLYTHLDEQLIVEQKKLTQQWITAECQEKFKQFVARGGEW